MEGFQQHHQYQHSHVIIAPFEYIAPLHVLTQHATLRPHHPRSPHCDIGSQVGNGEF